MTNELLPCPFCGQEVELTEMYSMGKPFKYSIDHHCPTPRTGTEIYMVSLDSTEQRKQELIETWNTRASLTDECSGCIHCHVGADWDTCETCARNWSDKNEVTQ